MNLKKNVHLAVLGIGLYKYQSGNIYIFSALPSTFSINYRGKPFNSISVILASCT